MKKLFTILFSLKLISTVAFAQTATLEVDLANTNANSFSVWIHNLSLEHDTVNKNVYNLALSKNKTAQHTLSIAKPQFVTIFCRADTTRSTGTINYILYLSPGDNVVFKTDFKKPDYDIKVSGKGSNNNQPLLALTKDLDLEKFNGDTIPNRVITAVKAQETADRNKIKEYVKQYKPDANFIKAIQINEDYYTVNQYFSFKENNKFGIRQAYNRNFSKWQRIQDSIFSRIKINNEAALIAPNYTSFIHSFLLREKERLWEESNNNPEKFYKDWYNVDAKTGEKLYREDTQNLLKEKIINKNFTGKAAEYLYGSLIDEALDTANPDNLVTIYENFKNKYPNSIYISCFEPAIKSIKEKQQQMLTNEMIFATNNGTDFKSINDILTLVKGKTVLLDMWGTWCGPCRSEMEKNGKYIKEHFKNKDLNYLYIANHDLRNEKKWKELIAYFHLNGTHILANEQLSKDIMAKVKGDGYPTYIIIKKDGSYELSKAGYPMDREILIKQLEKAITQ